MEAKKEFFQLISNNFTPEQIQKVEALCSELERNITNITAFYYRLSGLFYYSSKNFDSFYLNFENVLELDYTRKAFNIEIEQEKQWDVAYKTCCDKIQNFFEQNKYFQELVNNRPLEYSQDQILSAYCNALFDELYDNDSLCNKIEEYNDYSQLTDFFLLFTDPNQKVLFDKIKIEYTIKSTNKLLIKSDSVIIKSQEVQNRLKNLILKNFRYNTPLFLNKDEILKREEEYKDRKKKHIHRLIHRIILITKYFKLEPNSGSIYSGKGETSYKNEFLIYIFYFIKALGVDTSTRQNGAVDSDSSKDEIRTFIQRRIQNNGNDTFSTKDINTFYPNNRFIFYSKK